MLQKRCHALGRVGTIECYSAYYPSSFDGEPVYTPENRFYDIPFVDIGCAGMRETLANQARLDIRFEKLLAIEV
ncbi:uncharacterized protein FOMMEDRAFT_22956 [Fomitiporia mediterranea MF3/22]|uniref:uncharacterized protein n=1 Tax=Fomitiporia mediterranea (strain MF3/22) TaxID=694068 RepID=UPI00044094CC|nr:uncharacterized protein FOMMEDRAFT_22956 [Fomitiporia mediterranea MF3/22]EJC99433.1 hypothetical protein FOMMEDRAFT_22956 [Fomitiporia mediterranea MF3/22]